MVAIVAEAPMVVLGAVSSATAHAPGRTPARAVRAVFQACTPGPAKGTRSAPARARGARTDATRQAAARGAASSPAPRSSSERPAG